jgi:hypothetical protein
MLAASSGAQISFAGVLQAGDKQTHNNHKRQLQK